MLGKLFNYEFRATARLFIPLYLTLLFFSVINGFLIPISSINESASPLPDSPLYGLIMNISIFIYVALMIGLLLMTLLVMIQRFYKNLLGDEGYLMFTLPVQSWEHIFSKLAASIIWTVISGIVAILSIMIILSKDIMTVAFYKQLTMSFGQFSQYFGSLGFLAVFEILILGLLALASVILTIYASIALGHLFSKHKLIISFGMYIVLGTISQTLMVLSAVLFFNQTELANQIIQMPVNLQINTILLLLILFFGALSAGYFILTNYVLKRRLNLE